MNLNAVANAGKWPPREMAEDEKDGHTLDSRKTFRTNILL